MPIRTSLAVLLAAVAVLAGFGGAEVSGSAATARLLLDGAPLRPEIARTGEQRALGLMNRRRAPADGMLFVFPGNTTGGFWMKNTLVPLSIVFFDRQGKQVRRLAMTPCRRDPCVVYEPERTYRFALELRAGDRRPAKRLGPLAALQRLIRAAT